MKTSHGYLLSCVYQLVYAKSLKDCSWWSIWKYMTWHDMMTWHYNMRQYFYRLLTIWYICRHDLKCKPVVCSFDRLVFVWHATFAGGEGGFWIWARAFLGPVCIFLDPINGGWGYLAVNSRASHLSEEHSNHRSTIILHYDQWCSQVPFPRHIHIPVIAISFPYSIDIESANFAWKCG